MDKILTREEQKELAVKVMKNLGIMNSIIKAFEKDDEIMLTEAPLYASYDLDENQIKIVRDLESKEGCLVFHATHEYTAFGECLTLLIISKYAEDSLFTLDDSRRGLVFCWVENLTDKWCSEYGTCQFKLMPSGDIKRIA